MARRRHVIPALLLALLVPSPDLRAEDASAEEVQGLKKTVDSLEQTIIDLKTRIQQLEKAQKAAPPPVAAPAPAPTAAPPPAVAVAEPPPVQGSKSPVRDRRQFDDKQQAAPRPGDYTIDPQHRGFIRVPHTPFMIKFNPKPRLDMTVDTQNSGDDFRFVPAKIPVTGDVAHGGGEVFNMNGNGTQLRVDLRAPEEPGAPRFYYQNDFFGSDDRNFQYRLQHAYGQYYGIVAGFTYGVFEDPDAWPDTVDYEGPNAVIFARRPLVHYTHKLADDWNVTVGLEDPDFFLDTSSGDDTASRKTRAPDGGFNVRWEDADLGHMQFSTILRAIGADSDVTGTQNVFAWGVNLSGGLSVTERDTFLALVVYGEGVGGMGNDTSFVDSDAAFDGDGDLEALSYFSGLLGFTHQWAEKWRSTATYGYANLANTSAQPGSAYNYSHYASGNLVYQLRKRLSIGGEVLYGFKQVKSGANGDVIRFQAALVYSMFD